MIEFKSIANVVAALALYVSVGAAHAAAMTLSGSPPTQIKVGQEYEFKPTVLNANAAGLEFAFVNLPSWAAHSRSSGTIKGVPTAAGVYQNIQIQAWDGVRYAALRPFTITVVSASGSSGAGTAAGSTTIVEFTTPTVTVAKSTGSVTLPVKRSGSSTGTASVNYATANATATAGQNYTPKSGTLTWGSGDTSTKNIVVPVSSTVTASAVKFNVSLSQPKGANLGTPAAATVTIADSTSTTSSSSPAISVSGNKLLDAQGNEVQLRGVNVSGLEGVAVLGWSPSNPWGGATGTATPDWDTIKTWGVNAVRLPLNEASWLGLSCVDEGGAGVTMVNGVSVQNKAGTTVKADPGGNYQATVASSVAGATAAGLYVILDLHLATPGNVCPMAQNPMADADHSVAFWTSVATAFKGSPNVLFELFNEPYLDMTTTLVDQTPWADLLNGGATLSGIYAQVPSSPWQVIKSYSWRSAGMQQMLDAVRATGATNVVLTSALSYAGAIYNWLQYKPTDPLHQLAAVWHAYSVPQYPNQVDCVNMPSCSATIMASAVAIKAAGYPVVITEYGDTIGGSTAPWASVLLPFADTNNISYFGWAWDAWAGMSANVLITDAAGTPTQGYGTYVKAHYLCRAAGTAVCN